MGEYIEYNGRRVKLGTCEDLYYTRVDQLRTGSFVTLSGNASVQEYLAPNNGFRYRFPFPDEDDVPIGEYKNFDRQLIIQLDTAAWGLVESMEHNDVWFPLHPEGGGYNVNVAVPCPQSKEIASPHSKMDWRIAGICQQRLIESQVWTVIACPYCKAKRRLPLEDALLLAHSIKEDHIGDTMGNKDYYCEVVKRMLDGYKVSLA